MLSLIVSILLSYLLGSISGSLLVGRLKGIDIRKQGSGNAGGTNAFRTQGAAFALVVVLIDVGKGVLATLAVPGIVIGWLGSSSVANDLVFSLACGFAAVVGHVYPLYHQFRGGKGAGTFVGVLLATEPVFILPVVGIWILILVLTGYVGLSTMLAAVAFIPTVALLSAPEVQSVWLWFSVISAGFIVFTHRSNIQRLKQGTEHCFEKARLLRRGS